MYLWSQSFWFTGPFNCNWLSWMLRSTGISRVNGANLPWGQLRELTSQAPLQGSHPPPLTSSVSVLSGVEMFGHEWKRLETVLNWSPSPNWSCRLRRMKGLLPGIPSWPKLVQGMGADNSVLCLVDHFLLQGSATEPCSVASPNRALLQRQSSTGRR